jgi:hypothetical protein
VFLALNDNLRRFALSCAKTELMSSDLVPSSHLLWPLISNHEVWRGSVWYTGFGGEIERHGESESEGVSVLGSRDDEDR